MTESSSGAAPQAGREERTFQAEVQQLLQILIHSLYSHKEIFLRELISNAVDALDKMRFVQLTEKAGEDVPLQIKLECDETKGQLTVSDTGIGMTREELIENIGTIARSGTAEFLRQLASEKKKESALIGQFGVGFYSVFMVAERVRVITRSWKPGAKTVVWESEGQGTYTLSEHADTGRGTRIEIELKADETEFAKPARVREIVRRHSHYVPYPILLAGDTINEVTALWARPKDKLTKEEYEEFYKFITGRDEAPLSTLHFSLDTPVQMQALVYFPRHSADPMGMSRSEPSLSLYSRRVLIQDDSKELTPDWLRFVRGLVDSEDIPLNVSRESFQHNKIILNLRRQLVRKVISHLVDLAEKEPETYKTFFQEFGRHLKEAYHSDPDHREKLVPLLRFATTANEDPAPSTSLAQVVERMKEDQKDIYFISGSDRATLLRSPHLEVFRKNGIEVLLITDPLDDLLFSTMRTYEGKTLRAADQAGLDLKVEAEGEEPLAYRAKLGKLLDAMKAALTERVLDVRESKRLAESPCALVNPQEGVTAGIEKLLTLMNKDFVGGRRILEVNGRHPLVRHLAEVQAQDPESPLVRRAAHQLLDGAMMLEGLPLSPEETVQRLQESLAELAELRAKEKSD